VQPFLAERGLDVLMEAIEPALCTVRERARTLKEAAQHLDFFFRDPPELDEEARRKFLTPEAAGRLEALRALCADASPWDAALLEQKVKSWLDESGIAMKDVAQPARVALTGRKVSPGLFEVMVVLGRDRTLERLARGARTAEQGAAQD
jgi:glutamyl-tRNA synthetase